jgi:hypothetical protein
MSFNDQIFVLSVIYRFDPTQNFWTQIAEGRTR